MFLDIVGFRLEYKEKHVDWFNCTIIDVDKRKSPDHSGPGILTK